MPLVLFLILTPSILGQEPKSETAANSYEVLLKQYNEAKDALAKAVEGGHGNPTPEQRTLIREQRANVSAFAGRFFKLAEERPGSPIAFDALAAIASGGFSLDDEVRAFTVLVRNHAQEKRFAPLCLRLKNLGRSPAWPKAESWLRELIETSPHSDVKVNACFSLAEFITDKATFARYFERNPDETDQVFFKAMLGEGGVIALRESSPDKLDAEAEQLYLRVVEQHPKIGDPSGNLADQARSRLFALRNLGVGKVAPDIIGEDLDGKPMKLSDFRGRVVMLNFWATWCGPCMALLPRERALVARLRDRPFALVGVDGDENMSTAKKVAEKEGRTWRSFWDGGPSKSPIIARWDVHSWPTIYVLDHKGIIRHQVVNFPSKERFEDIIDRLLEEKEGTP